MNQEPISVLLIEDCSHDATIFRMVMERSKGAYALHQVRSLREGIACARTGQFSVIFTDLGLPDSLGLATVQELSSQFADAAIVVLSGQDDEQLYVDALAKGADDFLTKADLTATTLHRCVQQNLQRIKQREEICRLVQAVQEQSATVESQAQRLKTKNQRLEQLCDASQKFVNNVSHEFRTPLCVVSQYASLIADQVVGPANEEQVRMLRVIQDRVDDLNNMVDDMLDISRHESGLLAASRVRCDAGQIVKRLLPGLQQRASLRDIQLRFEPDDEMPELFCDPEKVSRTLINLIVNAIKFSPPSSTVEIDCEFKVFGKEVVFSVQDVGPGIPPDQCQHIFERFSQAASSLHSSTKGFGLGLDIAKELVELNLGSMRVSSEEGQGSVFSFSVPVDDPWEVTTRYLKRLPQWSPECFDQVTVLDVQLTESSEEEQPSRDIHTFFNYLLRASDLLVSVSSQHWFVLVNMAADELPGLLERIASETAAVNRNRPQGPLPSIELASRGCFHPERDRKRLRAMIQGDAGPRKPFFGQRVVVAEPQANMEIQHAQP